MGVNMQTVKGAYNKINNNDPITLAIGNFDGIHLGHQQLINKVKSFGDTKSAIMTFSPHPISVITNTKLPVLMDNHDKTWYMSKFKVNIFFIVDFTFEFSHLTVMQFIDFLKQINVKRIVIGRDFRFGYQGMGTVKDLMNYFEVHLIEDLLYKNIRISTTYIKSLLDNGDVEMAKDLLGREYSIHGEVVHGDKIGSLIGYPTANIDYGNYYLPKIGVYIVSVKIEDKVYQGALNLGHNPTINYSSTKRLEVFILNYNGNLYQDEITIYFEHYLRDELKFDSVEELLIQMKKDVDETLFYFKNK